MSCVECYYLRIANEVFPLNVAHMHRIMEASSARAHGHDALPNYILNQTHGSFLSWPIKMKEKESKRFDGLVRRAGCKASSEAFIIARRLQHMETWSR